VKRRSLASSDSSFASTSSSFLFSQSYPPPGRLTISVPSRTTASGTDATTPSLCSDNGADVDDRLPSTPPIAPSRNIYRFKGTGIPVNTPVPRGSSYEKRPEVIDVDMLGDHPATMRNPTTDLAARHSMMPPPPPKSPHARLHNPADLFAKRPPTSPMPAHSPRKPRPPARAKHLPPTPPRRRQKGSDDEDPLILTFSSPEQPGCKVATKSRIPRPRHGSESRTSLEQEISVYAPRRNAKAGPSKPERKSNANQEQKSRRSSTRSERLADVQRGESLASERSTSQVSSASRKAGRSSDRRLTLDEEIRDARRSGSDADDDDDEDDEESGVLVGVGTRSKRLGFLAHGGAGGAPVFMGVGYVDGAEDEKEKEEEREEEEEEEEEDDEYLPESRRRGSKPISSRKPARRRSRR
jgi:hypothetical protein